MGPKRSCQVKVTKLLCFCVPDWAAQMCKKWGQMIGLQQTEPIQWTKEWKV